MRNLEREREGESKKGTKKWNYDRTLKQKREKEKQ